MTKTQSIMIIAGEVSGDMHAAKLVRALKSVNKDIRFFGIGGELMRNEGVETFYDIKEMAVMGFSEVLRRISFFKKVFYHMVAVAEERKPDALILVDYPGFNLRFAGKAHELGIKTIYYICPQVWAWNKKRIPKMAKSLDLLISIFPFEKKHFDNTGLRVDYVGHPLVDEAREALDSPDIELKWNGSPKIALLPGSRVHEVKRILPTLLDSGKIIEDACPGTGFIIASPSAEITGLINKIISSINIKPKNLSVTTGVTRHVLRQATAAFVASGTATVETALLGCPMVIVYKVGWLTYIMGRLLIRVEHIGMVNIIADKRICPELIQHHATPDALAIAIKPLLTESTERQQMIKELHRVKSLLGEGNPEEKAAQTIISLLSKS